LRINALINVKYLKIQDHNSIIAALWYDLVKDNDFWTIVRVRGEPNEAVAHLVDWAIPPPVRFV